MNRTMQTKRGPHKEGQPLLLNALHHDALPWLLFVIAVFAMAIITRAQISISHLSTYATGSYNTSAAEIVSFDPVSDRIFFVNA